MKKFTLGYICSDQSYSRMAMVSLYSVFNKFEDINHFNEVFEELMVVTDETESEFVSFAKLLHHKVRVIQPSEWSKSGLAPYNNSFSTYFKFDLLFNLATNKTMIYIDSDAFIVDRFDLDYFEQLVNTSHTKDSILMVPSHRPVIEKIGYIRFTNPFNYYNAGFLVVNLSKKFTIPKFKTYLDSYGKSISSISTMGDQDLLNDYFRDSIKPLPLRYNVSTGLLKKTNFNKGALNYLVANEIKQVVIAHASGGILYTNKYYPFRRLILDITRAGINSTQLRTDHKLIFQQFYSNINKNNRFKINKFRQFFGLTSECSPYLYDTDIHWRKVIRKILKNLKISTPR